MGSVESVERYTRVKNETYILLNPFRGGPAGRIVDGAILFLILLSSISLILETVDPIADRYGAFFWYFEVFCVAVFTVEYLLRIWSITAEETYRNPVTGRFRYAMTPYLIIDLLAILPFYLGGFVDLRYLRILRVFRIFRLLKIVRYSRAIQSMALVFHRKREQLMITLLISAISLTATSSTLYYVENPAQPEAFSSIPATFWWGFATLTTVGYGDIVPVTPLGQFLGGLFGFIGIALFALPASILTAGFVEVATEREEEKKETERSAAERPAESLADADGDVAGDQPEASEMNCDGSHDHQLQYTEASAESDGELPPYDYCPHCGQKLSD